MKIYFRKAGKGKPLILLHGLLGSSDNMLSIVKYLEERYEVFIPDLRNHGHSPHDSIMNYSAMSDDLKAFFEDNKITSAILLGHSMGGKVAMQFALDKPELVEKLIVADMGIKKYPLSYFQYINTLKALDFKNITTRKEAEEMISGKIQDKGLVKLILKNLTWNRNKELVWRINIEAFNSNLLDAIISESIYNKPALFIKGAFSEFIVDEDFSEIKKKFPLMTVEIVPDAGHWVHVDNMNYFIKVVEQFIKK